MEGIQKVKPYGHMYMRNKTIFHLKNRGKKTYDFLRKSLKNVQKLHKNDKKMCKNEKLLDFF